MHVLADFTTTESNKMVSIVFGFFIFSEVLSITDTEAITMYNNKRINNTKCYFRWNNIFFQLWLKIRSLAFPVRKFLKIKFARIGLIFFLKAESFFYITYFFYFFFPITEKTKFNLILVYFNSAFFRLFVFPQNKHWGFLLRTD